MEILSWHFWSHRTSDRCLNFFSGQGALVVRVILLQIVNHSLRISQAPHTSSLWNPRKFGSFRSQGVITVWPRCKGNQFGCRHLTGLNLFEILCQFVLCRAAACKAERESVKQEHQAFSRHNVQLTRMKHHETWNFTKNQELDHSRTVRLSWMKRWNVAWSMYFGRPRSAKCL